MLINRGVGNPLFHQGVSELKKILHLTFTSIVSWCTVTVSCEVSWKPKQCNSSDLQSALPRKLRKACTRQKYIVYAYRYIYQTSAIPPFPITGPPPLKRDISQTCWRFIPYNYSMYAIFTYIYHKFMVNLGTYSIHGAFGYFLSPNQYEIFNPFLPQQRWKKNIHLSSPKNLAKS